MPDAAVLNASMRYAWASHALVAGAVPAAGAVLAAVKCATFFAKDVD